MSATLNSFFSASKTKPVGPSPKTIAETNGAAPKDTRGRADEGHAAAASRSLFSMVAGGGTTQVQWSPPVGKFDSSANPTATAVPDPLAWACSVWLPVQPEPVVSSFASAAAASAAALSLCPPPPPIELPDDDVECPSPSSRPQPGDCLLELLSASADARNRARRESEEHDDDLDAPAPAPASRRFAPGKAVRKKDIRKKKALKKKKKKAKAKAAKVERVRPAKPRAPRADGGFAQPRGRPPHCGGVKCLWDAQAAVWIDRRTGKPRVA